MSALPPDFLVFVPLLEAELAPQASSERSVAVEACGGCMALVLLAEALRSQGYRVDVVGRDALDRVDRLQEHLASGATIAIYPEAIEGNPIGAARVVRWVLYFVDEARIRAWQANGDMILYYWRQFDPMGRATGAAILRVMDAGLDRFRDEGRPRGGVIYRLGKGIDYHPTRTAHTTEALSDALLSLPPTQGIRHLMSLVDPAAPSAELADGLSLDALGRQFNSVALFISYDCETALSAIAALCGCASVVVPRPGMTKRDRLRCFRYGVAFGVGDLPRALASRERLRVDLLRLELEGRRSVSRFARRALAWARSWEGVR